MICGACGVFRIGFGVVFTILMRWFLNNNVVCFVLVWVWLYLVLGGCLFVVCAAVSRCVWIVICYSGWFGVGWFTGWFVGGVVVFVVSWFLVSFVCY